METTSVKAGSLRAFEVVSINAYAVGYDVSDIIQFPEISGNNAFSDDTTGIVCPDNISTYTDVNSCNTIISSGLELGDPENSIVSLSWQMEGATVGNSTASGVNQLTSYVFNEGTTIVTYRGRDRSNQSIFCSFTVVVADNEVPRLMNPPQSISVEADPGDCHAIVNWQEPIVLDNCASRDQIIVDANYMPGSAFPVGTTEVFFSISDGVEYNRDEYSFTVTVTDDEKPEIYAPNPIRVRCGGPVPDAYTSWREFTEAGGIAFDNCNINPGSFRFVSQKSSGIRCPYVVTRIYSIADDYGNITEVEHLVYITGEEPQIDQEEPDKSAPPLKSGTATTTVTISLEGITNVSCYGGSDGAIDLDTSSTNGPISSIAWDDGPTTLDRTGLSSGTYTIRITDGDGIAVQNYTVDQPNQLNASVSSTDITCNGANDGEITVSNPGGGYGTYEVSINGSNWYSVSSGSSYTFSSLSVSNYMVQIRDAAHIGCTRTLGTENITEPSQLSATVTSTDITCNGSNDGTITVSNPGGGYGTYEVSINGSNWYSFSSGSSYTFSSLSVSNYTVQIRDAAHIGCTRTLGTENITEPSQLSATVTSTDITCNGSNDGTITVSLPTGGYGTYEYRLNSGSWQNSGSFSNLSPGSYSVQIRDKTYTTCEKTLTSITITQPAELTASASITSPILCYNGTATIQVSASGGTAPYTYYFGSSSNSNGIFSGITGAVSGTNYSWHVVDANGCSTSVQNLPVTQPEQLTASASAPDISCHGGVTTVTITASGGTSPLSYTLNGVTKNNGTFAGITAGTYTWSVKDVNNCTPVTGSIEISEPDVVTITSAAITSAISCNGGTATVTIVASGGSGNYNYTFNGETNTSGVFTGVYAGTNLSYSVKDDNDCGPAFGSITVDDLPALNATLTPTQMLCNGGSPSGEIEVSNPTGGSGNYEVSIGGGWFPVSGTSPYTFTGLATGNYYVEIRDQATPLCIQTLPVVTITQPPVLNASATADNILCYDGTTEVQITVSGGTPGYSYTFNGSGDADGTITDVLAGNYKWKVTDANGCADSSTITITQPAEITNLVVTVDESEICEGENIKLHASASGGTPTLKYNWIGPNNYSVNNTQNPVRTNAGTLAQGWYVVTVVDANGCRKKDSVSVTVHPSPDVTATPSFDEICSGSDINISLNSSVPVTTFNWTVDTTGVSGASDGSGSTIAQTLTATGNTPGTVVYTVTPTSPDYCGGEPVEITIAVLPELELTITPNTPVFCGNGNVSITLNSNVAGTSYHWDYSNGNPGSGNVIDEFLNNTHTYTIYAEANGCYSDTLTTTITVINDNFDLDVNTSGPNDTVFCPGEPFEIGFYGSPTGSGSWTTNNGFSSRTEYQWVTKFHYSVSNPNVVLNTTGGPINDGTAGSPASLPPFNLINSTDEVQTAIISITPWAYQRSRNCTRFLFWWDCSPDWNSIPWTQLCAGESYEVEITVQPYTISCPDDITIYSPTDDCEAHYFRDNSNITTCASSNTTISWDLAGATSVSGQNGDIDYDFNLGETTVTLTSNDPNNTTDPTRTCTFDVTVLDTVSPTINCPASDVTIYAESDKCGAIFDYTIKYSDNCTIADSFQTEGLPLGSEFPIGTTTLSFYAEDASGNSTECSFDVIVVDTISPIISCVGDVSVCAEPLATDYTNIGTGWNATAIDNCSEVTVSYKVDGSSVGNTLNNVSFTVAGSPHNLVAIATDAAGRKDSCLFQVTVNEKPAVAINEGDQSVCLKGTATFTATASGTPAPTLQWRKDGVALSDDANYAGTGSETLIISGLSSTHTGNYDVVATNSCGTATSTPAVLTVSSAPVITTQPATQSDCKGNSVVYSVVATGGTTPYSYVWEMMRPSEAWISAGGQANITVTDDELQVDNAGNADNPDQTQYRVIITDDCGNSDTSAVAGLIINQIEDVELSLDTICEGEGTSFTVTTAGSTPVSFEWIKHTGPGAWTTITDGGVYSGATTATLTINNATTAESGEYSIRATFNITVPNNNNSTTCRETDYTEVGELTVDPGPSIVATTSTPTICPGKNVKIKIYDANGAPGVTYTWSRDNETVLIGNFSESTVADTLFLNGTLSSVSPGTFLTTTFSITGATVHGCESTGQITITVGDEEMPTVESCPKDTSIYSETGICGAVVNYTLPTFSDNCDSTGLTGTLATGPASGETFPVGITTVIYEYTDAAGNGPVTCSFNITVKDTISPTAICKDIPVQLDASGIATITAADVDNNSADNCGIETLIIDITSFNCTNLGDNIVTLTATDSVGNTATCTATVTVKDDDHSVDIIVDSITQTPDPIDCYNGTATVTIHAHGGVGDLTYTFNGVTQPDSVFTAIAAGNYSWNVTDGQHCGDTFSVANFVVVQVDELSANITLTEVTCSSGNDGKITVIGSAGGSGDYEYQLLSSVENRTWQSDSVFANLSPGVYDIWMRDANAPTCEKAIQTNVEVYIITADISSSDVSCYGGNDGSITISNPAGGTSPYQYSHNGGVSWQSSGEFTGLPADTFEVRIRDNDACIVVLDSMVILTQPNSLYALADSSNITCNGANNGTISIHDISGGSGSYEFNIGSGWQNDSLFNNLVSGTYSIQMRDAVNTGCTRDLGSITIEEPAVLAAVIDSVSVSCNGEKDGQIQLKNISGGWGAYEFSIDGGANWQSDSVFTLLFAGTYDIRIRGSADTNCEEVLNSMFELMQPPALVISTQPVNVAICKGLAAEFAVVSSDGAGAVSFTWQKEVSGIWTNLANSGILSGVNTNNLAISSVAAGDAGSYRVILEDNCLKDTSDVVTLVVNEITGISESAVICEGENYTFSVTTSGATPVSYQWQANISGAWANVADNGIISGAASAGLLFTGATPAESGEYRVQVSFDSCQINSETRELLVHPIPTVDSITFPEYCAGQQTTAITLSGSPSGVAFTISGGSSVGLFLTAKDSLAIPQFTTQSGTDTLTIIPRANGCFGEPYKLPLTVNPTPNIGVSLNKQTICSGSVTDIDFSSYVDSVSYTWEILSAGSSITGYTTATDTIVDGLYQTLYNSGSGDEKVVYRIYAKNESCPGPTVDVTITVEPDFTLQVTNPDPDTVCSPNTIDLTDAAITAGSKAGLDYEWYNGHPDSTGSSVISNAHNISVSGTYYIKATDLSSANYCYKVDSVTVLVAPEPVLVLLGTDTVYKCPLDSYYLQNSVDFTASNVSNIKYWGTDSLEMSNPVVGINEDGTYFITGENDAGCEDTIVVIIKTYSTVGTPEFADGTYSDVCQGDDDRVYTATASNATQLIYSIDAASQAAGNSIDSQTGELHLDPSYTGEIQITVTARGCTDLLTTRLHTVMVHKPPGVVLTASDDTICAGGELILTAQNTGETTNVSFTGSNTTNYSIPDNSTTGASSGINLAAATGYKVSADDEIIVTVKIAHTYNADLDIFLVDPSGTRAMLLSSDNGGGGDGYGNVPAGSTGTVLTTNTSANNLPNNNSNLNGTFRVEGSITTAPDRSGAANGNYNAVIPANALEGATINGNWKLMVFDDERRDTGTLLSWSLEIKKEITTSFVTVFSGEGTTNDSIPNTGTAMDTIYPEAGTHTYVATTIDENGCVGVSNEVTVVVQQSPEVTIVADYCVVPGRVQLTAVGGEPGAYYEWTTGDKGTDVSVIVVDEVRLYGVTVTNPGGTCSRTVYLKVSNELAINGDFEMGPAGVGTFFTQYAPDNTITGDGYMGEGVYGIGTNARDFYPAFRGAYDHTIGDGTGYFFVIDGTGSEAIVWQQEYTVTPNTNYYFAAWALNIYLDETYGGTMNPHLQFEINDSLIGTDVLLDKWTPDDSNPWLDEFRFYGTWNSGSATTARVRIRNLISGLQRNDFALDDISFGTLDPLPLTMNLRDTAFCEGGTVRAESNSINGLNPVYTWTHLASGTVYYTDTIPYLELTNIAGSDEGYYKLEVDDGYGCEVVPDTFFIEVLDAATVDAGEDGVYCSLDSTIVLSGSFGGSADSAIWSGEGAFIGAPVVYSAGGNGFTTVRYHFSGSEISSGTATLVLTANPGNSVCGPVTDTLHITIYESPVIDSVVVHSPVCNGQTNGNAVVYASGGTGPGTYSYLWGNGKTSRILTGVGADTLWVTVTDGNGCEVTDTVIITEPDSLVISARSPIVIPPSCYGSNDGMAIIEVEGGIPPYTFEWDATAALYAHEDTAFNLAAGQYTVLVTDSAGCAAQTFPVEVSQPDPPELICPGDYIDSILPGNCGLVLDTLANPTADGYCDYALYYYLSGDTVASDSGSLTYFEFPVGQTWVKYVIDDGYNRDSCEYLVWIKHVDIPEPDISCAGLSPDPVYADASCEAYVALNPPVYSDPCNEIDSIWNNSPYGTATDASGTYPVGTWDFKWFVQDKSGNMDSSCVVQVIVLDTIKPYITCPGNAIDTAAANNCSKVSGELTDPVWGDDCSDATLSWKMEGATSGQGDGTVTDSAFNVGLTTVTYFVEDESGTRDSCSFTVQIIDVTDPYINIGCESVTDTAAANLCSKVSGKLKDPVLEDNCWDSDSLTLSWIMSGATTGSGSGSVKDSTFNVGVTTVTYTVTDPDENSGECTFTVTIVDVIDPEIKVGCANVTDTLAPDECSKISAEIDDPVLEDNCWSTDSLSLRWTMSGATTGSGLGSVADSSFNTGITTVTYIVTDPDNNSDSCTFTVTILHLNIPAANFTCPQDTVWAIPEAGNCAADVTLDALTYTDPCNEIDSVWNNSPYRTSPADASGTYLADTTTFNWYITDFSGNIDSCTVTVIVEDLPPTIDCPDSIVDFADFGKEYNSAVSLQDPVYGDNCPDPVLTWRLIPPTGFETEYNSSELSGTGVYISPDTFWIGVTTIWYYIEDSNRNRDSCNFTITITAAPEIECPPDTTIYLDGTEDDCSVTFDPGVADLVEGAPPITWSYTIHFADGSTETDSYVKPDPSDPASDKYADPLGDRTFPLGVTTIEWRAENDAGFDTCSHWVEVLDTIPPTLTADPYENCVDPLHWAVYNEANPNPVYNHIDPLVEKYPVDFRTLYAGDTFLDLTSLEDNCCDSVDMTIHWRIDFADTLDPITGAATIHPSITGTGQPSTYEEGGIPTDIYLWGDGVLFTKVTHTITYWVEDCNGNPSEELVEEITITPRPEVRKEDY